MTPTTRRQVLSGAGVAALGAVGLLGAAPAHAAVPTASSGGTRPQGDRTPIFDFTDAYYRANGVDPTKLAGRPTGADPISVPDRAPASHLRDVRLLLTLPAYDFSGGHEFFTVLGDLQPGAFPATSAGRAARALAEDSVVYVFPVRGGDPLGVGNSRQADLIDLSGGYFSNNPLGLWVHVFVNWTPRAFTTAAGRATLADLAARNGTALDGTPRILSDGEVRDLTAAKLVTQRKRAVNATGRWFVCPVFKDPRRGAIARDAFLAVPRGSDGQPSAAERSFVDEFTSLQTTGEW